MKITKLHTIEDIQNQIENGTAKAIVRANFDQGNEDEIKTEFFSLWGEIVRKVYNRGSTVTEWFFVKDDNKDLFLAHYGRL